MNHDSDWGRSTWLSPMIMMGGLLFCVGFGAFVYRSDNERNRQYVIEATADRERLNRNNAQILTIVFEGLEAWQKSCAAQIDEDGVIVKCNARYEKTYGKGVGSNIEEIMPDDVRQVHHQEMTVAVKRHPQSPVYTSIDSYTLLPGGKKAATHVRAWTIDGGGGMGFFDVKEDAD